MSSPALAATPPPARPPLPQASGPLAVSASSYPWNAANQNVTPLNLASFGYQESEYLVSGVANIYTYADSATVVQTPNAPYRTRIVVRRPGDPARFSGNVVVEMLNESYGFDLDFIWPASHEYLMANGDAWVGVTMRPSSIQALKKFDPQRYSSLSMATPLTTPTCSTPFDSSTTAWEAGLGFDIASQVGVLLHSSAPSSPLAGLNVQKVYATGYSSTANFLEIYANAISPYASLPNGAPIFDGFLIGAAPGGVAGGIHQCAGWIPAGDPRVLIQPNRSPVIRLNTTSDFGWYFAGPANIGMPSGGTLNRRKDSDAPNDRYRGYEVPGATHVWTQSFAFQPAAAETARIGGVPTHPCGQTPTNNFPLQYFIDGALDNLNVWARGGAAPPHAPYISLNNAASASESIVFDTHGNPAGGVRSPYLDVPRNTYDWYNDGAGCGASGHLVPLPGGTLQALYPTSRDYQGAFIDATLDLVLNHWVPEMDGREMILDAVAASAS